ncbi:MAG: winged helix-turn-helix domain-containing protein [Candidatus Hodarchaeota archaeon]
MTNKIESNGSSQEINDDIEEEKLIVDHEAVPILFHPKKQMLLKLLVENEMTIIDLKRATGMNPGTVKRHLNDLLEKGLVKQSRIEINRYSIAMRFYRATAKQFIISIKWPLEA